MTRTPYARRTRPYRYGRLFGLSKARTVRYTDPYRPYRITVLYGYGWQPYTARLLAVYLTCTRINILADFLSHYQVLPNLRVLFVESARDARLENSVVIPMVELPCLKHADLCDGCTLLAESCEYSTLETLSASFCPTLGIRTGVREALEAAPHLRALTLRDMDGSQIEYMELDKSLRERLFALPELHLSGLSFELERWFSEELGPVLEIPRLSVSYAPANVYRSHMCKYVASTLYGALDMTCERAGGRTALRFREYTRDIACCRANRARVLNIPDPALHNLWDLFDASPDSAGPYITTATLDARAWAASVRVCLPDLSQVSKLTIIVRDSGDMCHLAERGVHRDLDTFAVPDLDHLTLRCPAGGMRISSSLVCRVLDDLRIIPSSVGSYMLSHLTLEGIALFTDDAADGESDDERESLSDYADFVHIDAPVEHEWTGIEEFVSRARKAARGA
ncbi:hypothetical protein AURDEDRAFT_165381 [Auricularia subglabra TFB-10046 SS5]|nr:hypothetical protein AURDEDRAFT_165381 [Auricularia subglabra TFB-10046 SS5]